MVEVGMTDNDGVNFCFQTDQPFVDGWLIRSQRKAQKHSQHPCTADVGVNQNTVMTRLNQKTCRAQPGNAQGFFFLRHALSFLT